MCGRFAVTSDRDRVLAAFDVTRVVRDPHQEFSAPSYNIAPTTPIDIVLEHDDARELRPARWGLVPSWAKDAKGGARMFNARAETITEKPAFRSAARARRCVVPADGYFEWAARDGKKAPYYLQGAAESGSAAPILALAGLYEFWRDPADGAVLLSATILTAASRSAAGAPIHDREPLILPLDMLGEWLDPGLRDPAAVQEMVAAVPVPSLTAHRVGAAVGSPRNNGPELLAPVND
jgi:putative SOS response-associated peptidase YedK